MIGHLFLVGVVVTLTNSRVHHIRQCASSARRCTRSRSERDAGEMAGAIGDHKGCRRSRFRGPAADNGEAWAALWEFLEVDELGVHQAGLGRLGLNLAPEVGRVDARRPG